MEAILSLRNINKYAGRNNDIHILKDISIDIKEGEFLSVIGQSGSGKSSLLNILGCLDSSFCGVYSFKDKIINHLAFDELALLRNRTFGFIFQKYHLIPNFTSIKNVELPAVYYGMPAKLRKKRAAELLDALGLADKHNNFPDELSGGQQQRISIARALMNGGKILLADEPTGALDSENGNNVLDILKRLHYNGYTIVVVTHNMNIAREANRILEIQDGKIVSDSGDRATDIKTGIPDLDGFEGGSCTQIKKIDILYECFKMALSAICYHKVRSLLTMLGIIIGIASVVSVLALGNSSQEKILNDISAIGTNTLEIFPGKVVGDTDSSKINTLNIYDASSLSIFNFIDAVSPKIIRPGILTYKNISLNCIVNGVDRNFFHIRGLDIIRGNTFEEGDIAGISSKIIIDTAARDILFPDNAQFLHKVIFLNKHPFLVTGIVKTNIFTGNMNSPNVYTPYSTAMYKIFGSQSIDSIILRVKQNVTPHVAEKVATAFLVARHKGIKDFFIFNSDNIRIAAEKAARTMTILISGIALIALVVGGIGVMNIMFVSVSERTSEIGLRMALGARKQDILGQFLIESIIICLLGGILGIIFSLLLVPVINIFITDFIIRHSLHGFMLALPCSIVTGIIFGYIPAKNAAKLSPKEALNQG